jgi:hypothetical protein
MVEPRTDLLLARLGMSWAQRPAAWLDSVEAGVSECIWTNDFWKPSQGPQTIVLRARPIQQDLGPSLSGVGEALGADLGLVLARSFLTELGDDVRWIIGRHGRTYVSNNLPVLKGRGKAEFDPLLIGMNLASRYLPDHTRNPHELGLSELHDRWLADLANPAWGSRNCAPGLRPP